MKTLEETFFPSKNLKTESALTSSEAQDRKLALHWRKQGTGFTAIVYNPIEFNEILLGDVKDKKLDDRFIKGVIRAYPLKHCEAYEISIAAALHGFGPLMYQILSSQVGWIVSDRIQISSDAERVWLWMFNHPESWEKQSLIEKNNKCTYKNGKDVNPKNPLNYRYVWKGNGGFIQDLIKNHSTATEILSKKHENKDIEDILSVLGGKFFDKRYF